MQRFALLACLLSAACGAKTGLKVPNVSRDASVDARDVGVDAPDAFDGGPDACVPFRAEARLASLDIFLLMDSSGSMEDLTASGETKFTAITRALDGFVSSPESEGLGVGLTFFPFEDTSVPEFCGDDRQCGADDACFMPDVCFSSGDLCLTNADCPARDCAPLGRCGTLDASTFCFEIGGFCPDGTRCVDFGLCENRTSCRAGDYTRPEVGLGLLPEVAPRIITALETRELVGSTPTTPALQGVLDQADAWSLANPGSKVIVLLATDGFPAACDPEIDPIDPDPMAGIAAASAVAADGLAEGIQTFVIGVFAPEDESDARANLSTLARAGGSDAALVVTTDEPVTEMLLRILGDLRRDVRTCVYAIPHEGVLPDPRTLQVRILPPMGAPIELRRVDTAEDCDPVSGGFYFQQDIDMGERPGFIELCPATCSMTAASDDFIVEMQAGCDLPPG